MKEKRTKGFKNMCKKLVWMLAFVMLFLCFFTGCNNDENVFITVNGEKFSEDEFKFICSLVLEDEAFVHSTYYDADLNFTEEVKSEAKKLIKEIVVRLKIAQNEGYSLTDEEKEIIKEDADYAFQTYGEQYVSDYTEDEFYKFFYGISKADYLKFREKWALVAKYNEALLENADLGRESQLKTYEQYEDFLKMKSVSVIVFDLTDKSTAEITNSKNFADLLVNKVRNGEDFDTLMKQYSDDEELTKSGGVVSVGASIGTVYPELYKWSLTAEVGAVGAVTEDDAIFVVKCNSVLGFEDLLDSETLLYWTKSRISRELVEADMSNSAYDVQVEQEKYDNCDISELISQSVEYWTEIWSVYGFPATSS